MPKLLRSYITRNLILLFSGLTILFSALVVIIPSIYRIKVEEKQVLEQKRLIDSKVQSTYLPQAIYKAKYLDQLLNAQEKDVLILSDAAGKLISNLDISSSQYSNDTDARNNLETPISNDILENFRTFAHENNCTFYSSDPNLSDPEALDRQIRVSAILATMQSIVRRDPIIQDVFIRTIDQTEWVCPQPSNLAGHYQTYEYADQYYFPMTVAEWSIRWNTQFVDGIPVITVIAPIWSNGKFYGEAGISLQLTILANQIPQYNLSDTSQMIILDNDGNVMALPSWVSSSSLVPWITNEPSQYLNRPFTELMSEVLGETLLTSHLQEKIKATTPLIFPIETNGETHYFALAPVGIKSIKLLVIMPLEDVYTTLSFWGNSFTTDLVPVLLELGISILGISLILTAGAALSIRYFSRPIQEVSNTALSIAEGDLSQRVPEKWGGELLELARSFNTMANNVQTSEKELLSKKDELSRILEIQKKEFNVIRQVVALTNQVSKLSKKLLDVIDLVVPLVETPAVAILLIDKGKVYQSIIHKTDWDEECLSEETLFRISEREVLAHPERYSQEKEIYPIYFTDSTDLKNVDGFALPIMERGVLIGLMYCCYDHQVDFSHVRQPFLSVLSNYIAVIIENANLQEKKRDLIISEERQHMANELHDAISQSLFSLILTEESVYHQIKHNGDVNTPLEFLMEQTQHIQEEMRWLINELRPIALHRDNLTNSVQRQISNLQRLCPELEIRFDISDKTNSLPIDIQNHLNRIMQEALSNIIRHANAKHLEISLKIEDTQLSLEIIDDGIGFDLDQLVDGRAESYGIISMFGRTDQIKGTIDIQTAPELGTKILVQTNISE